MELNLQLLVSFKLSIELNLHLLVSFKLSIELNLHKYMLNYRLN